MSDSSKPDDFIRLQGYFRALHIKSKRGWALSILLTILALFPVPLIALLLDSFPRWPGLILACILAVAGKLFGWRGGIIGAEADGLQRMSECHRALGWPIDQRKTADLRAKYGGLDRSAKKRTIDDYYEKGTTGGTANPGFAMAKMYMESTWWTKQLARKTDTIFSGLVVLVVVLSGFLIVYSWLAGTSVDDGVIGLVVFFILLSDLILLHKKYVSLERAASSTYDRLQGFVETREDAITISGVPIAVIDYLIARSVGPPIPEKVYECYRSRLNKLWKEELSSR